MRNFNPEKELNRIQKGNKNKIIISVIALLLVIAIGSSYALYQVRYSKRIIYTKVGDFSRDLNLAVFVDGVKQKSVPPKDSGYKYAGIECDDGFPLTEWDEKNWNFKQISNINVPNKCNVYFTNIIQDFNYTNSIQEYTVPKDGVYKLEVWGAQGGGGPQEGGFGGYATGDVYLEANSKLYIVIGGNGTYANNANSTQEGGYNGGGTAMFIHDGSGDANVRYSSGGGATHIATSSGVLADLENDKESILIVAGGGGGVAYNAVSYYYMEMVVGSGGGATGGLATYDANISGGNHLNANGGTQTTGGGNSANSCGIMGDKCTGKFGIGGIGYAGGGGGFYGGGSVAYTAAGGSGYIGNDSLNKKVMVCYHCEENGGVNIKTISTENISDSPISMYAKRGAGAARISYLRNN